MPELRDFELDPDRPSATAEPPPETGPPADGPPPGPSLRRSGMVPLLIGAVAVAAVIVVVFWLLSREVSKPDTGDAPAASTGEPSPDVEGEPTRAAVEPAEVEPLPPLAESDGFVRELVRRLSSHPSLSTWLATPYLVERFVATVENIANGTNPASHLGALAPKGSYQAVDNAGTLEPAPTNAIRYQALTQVFTALDPEAVAVTYRRLRPLLQESYAELGYPDGSFDDALAAAIRALLATPIPERPPALERRVASFGYVNPDLEALPPAQKAFLRMGSENMRRIKAQLQALADALDMDVR